MSSISLSAHYNDPLPDMSHDLFIAGSKHILEGLAQLGIATSEIVASEGVLAVVAAGPLFGLITGGVVSLGVGIGEISAGWAKTPLNEKQIETALGVSPQAVGIVVVGELSGVPIERTVDYFKAIEVLNSAWNLHLGSDEIPKILENTEKVSEFLLDNYIELIETTDSPVSERMELPGTGVLQDTESIDPTGDDNE